MIGLKSDSLEIVDHDPNWLIEFENEKNRLMEISDFLKQPWEHIGSTAVQGLSAKPIIDMMIATPIDQIPEASALLKKLNYSAGGFLYNKMDFLMFKQPQPVTHILHLVEIGSQEYQDKIDFREYLRSDERVRRNYQELKLKMSRRLGENRKDYGRYKGHFINNRLKDYRKLKI